MATARNLQSRPAASAPAIWTAFAHQAAWKNWVLVAQLFVIALLVLATLRLSRRAPDVVVVGPDGKSTYVARSVAGDALVRFLDEQKQQPSDVTIAHFTRDFLELAFAVNSSTIDAVWPRVLARMSPGLRVKVAAQSEGQRLVDTYKLARVRTDLTVDELVLAERTPELVHVKAVVSRRKESLLPQGGTASNDKLAIELVERIVPRSPDRPDGLEVADWTVETLSTPAKEGGEDHAH